MRFRMRRTEVPRQGDSSALDEKDTGAKGEPAAATEHAELPRFGEGFLWGAGTSAFQVEQGLVQNTDWGQWEGMKGLGGRPRIKHGDRFDDGPDFAHLNTDGTPGGRFPEYLAEAAKMGHTSFRLSIEWSRIQPTRDGPYDPRAIALYRAILEECAKNGLRPIVTLQHFSLPVWLHDVKNPEAGLGGWAGPKGSQPGEAPIVEAFAKFAGDMAREFGDRVDHWITINEPSVMSSNVYLAGTFPGPAKMDVEAYLRSERNMIEAHARAYDAIHAADRIDGDGDGQAAQVGLAIHMRDFEPLRPGSARDRDAAEQFARLGNATMLDAVTRGQVDLNGDGRFDLPGEAANVEALKGKLDWVGANYYSRDRVLGLPFSAGPKGLKFKGIPVTGIPHLGKLFKQGPLTDLDWEIHPSGMHDMVLWAWDRYRLPIIITENGMAEGEVRTSRRPDFLLQHVGALQEALRDGADVRGYIHWALMDNFELADGLEKKFGLFHVDFGDPEKPFAWSAAADAYQDLIAAGGVTDELRRKWEYAEPERLPAAQWLKSLASRARHWLAIRLGRPGEAGRP